MVNRNSRSDGEVFSIAPTDSYTESGQVEMCEIVGMSHGTGGCIFSVVMGLAVYLHPICGFFVVVLMVLMQFVGFKATSWFDRLGELSSMTKCILTCVSQNTPCNWSLRVCCKWQRVAY